MIFYAISVALILAGCFVFYKILLQRETFFPLNRFVLLGCLVLSFGLPFIPIPQQFSFRKTEINVTEDRAKQNATAKTEKMQLNEPTKAGKQNHSTTLGSPKTNGLEEQTDGRSFFKDIPVLTIILWVYWTGVVVFGLNFLVQLAILCYRVYSRPFIQDGRFRIVEVAGDQAPCSFANSILINPEKYDWDTYSQIILHEKIHIQQGHSYDIIFAELALIFQWFNPFAWLYRKAMEDNLEFLTDNELLQHSDIEPQSYQLSLVKVSAPNFPASLTTNYNQSILKRRLIMMNTKKSNINSTWKYLCIVPLLLVFVSLLNEPIAYGKVEHAVKEGIKTLQIANRGTWFATIKGDNVQIRFVEEGANDGKNNSSTEFKRSELGALPINQKGSFSVARDAGRMNFNGRFEGNAGMGNYEFIANESFLSFLKKEHVAIDTEKDAIVFFFVNVKRDFVAMLKSFGYDDISKGDLIALSALNVNESYLRSIEKSGLDKPSLQDLIPLKALNVDQAYIEDIKKSGYKNLTAQKLVSLKAQGIDGEFIKNAKSARVEGAKDTTYPISRVTSKKTNHAISGDDDEDDEFGMMIAKKVLNVSAEYAKSFSSTGLKLSDEALITFKSMGITPEFIKGFQALNIPLDAESFAGLKATGLTPADYKAYEKLGFQDLDLEDVIGAKATGTTPAFIATMKKKGYNYSKIDKYIAMKVTALGEH